MATAGDRFQATTPVTRVCAYFRGMHPRPAGSDSWASADV